MKKTLLSLFAILMATVAYAGDGTKENPFTIAEVKTNCPTDGSAINDVYVKGYIVGTAKSGSAFAEEPVNSNLFIADSQTETDANNCVPVELKKGSNARTELNLVDHPDNLGKLIVLCGSITKYFSVPGVKSVTEFSFSEDSTNPGDSGSGDPGTTTQTNYIFTKATSLTNGGKYLIGAMVDGVVKVAQNLPSSSTHGYLKVTNATEKDGKIKMSSLEDVYTISGSNIIDSQNRYVYQTGTYNSFNVAADAPEGVDWTITFNGDGTVMITNDDVQKTIQYDAQHDSYGSYDDVHGIYPALYLLTGTEEVTPEPPVETPISTIAAVQAGEVGLYRIQGTVVATSSRGALVYDTTGYIYIFDQAISAAVGDKVDVEGTTSDYGGFKQFSANNKYTMTKTGTVTVTHPAAVELDLDAWAAAPVMQYVKLTGNLAISGNYYNVTVDGKTAVGSLVYPTDEIKAKLTEGEVTVFGYAVYITTSKGTTYVNIITTSVGTDTAVKGINAEQKTQEIYDMTGRRVSRMTKGLYIVGGKKILK